MAKFDVHMRRVYRKVKLKPGDIYEDCSYHPVLCLGANYKDDEVWGVSLIDGSYPRMCSFLHCGVRRLTAAQAWRIKNAGPLTEEDRARVPEDRRWWRPIGERKLKKVAFVGPRPAARRAPVKSRAEKAAPKRVRKKNGLGG